MLKLGGQTPFRRWVHASLAGTDDAWWRALRDPERLLELPALIEEADRLPQRLDTVAELSALVPRLVHFSRAPLANATFDQQAGYRANGAGAEHTARALREAGHPLWAIVEEVQGHRPFFQVTVEDVRLMRGLLDTYPQQASLHARCGWLAAHRAHRPSAQILEATMVWHEVCDRLASAVRAEVEPALAELEARGLVATALVQRAALEVQVSWRAKATRMQIPEGGKGKVYTGKPGLALVVRYDPPFAETHGEARDLIARLHGEPWLERPLHRVFGIAYDSWERYRSAAAALEVEPGHVRLTRTDAGWRLTPSERAPLVSMSPWIDFSTPWAATSAETRELGKRLRDMNAQIEAQAPEIEARAAELNAWAQRIDARVQRWNQANARGQASRSEQDQIRQDQARFTTAREAAEARRRAFNALVAEHNALVPPYNTRLNQERSEARRKDEAEQDAALRAWFEDQVARHEASLVEAGVEAPALTLELDLLRWLLGLGPQPRTTFARPQGDVFEDAYGFAQAKLEAVRSTLWERGDSEAIAAGVLLIWELLADATIAERRLQEITPTVERYVRQYDRAALLRQARSRPGAGPLVELIQRLTAGK
ncbi:MAG: hypothetical protein R3F62_12675 [Planctomycetota bacterium]